MNHLSPARPGLKQQKRKGKAMANKQIEKLAIIYDNGGSSQLTGRFNELAGELAAEGYRVVFRNPTPYLPGDAVPGATKVFVLGFETRLKAIRADYKAAKAEVIVLDPKRGSYIKPKPSAQKG